MGNGQIGHAMRMAIVEGFHRALPVEQLGRRLVDRCSNIWWTVYILDRKFASLNGSPNSINDDEITTVLWDPRTSSKKEAALSLNVRISQVITRVLNSELLYHILDLTGLTLCSCLQRGWNAWRAVSQKATICPAGDDRTIARVGGCFCASFLELG